MGPEFYFLLIVGMLVASSALALVAGALAFLRPARPPAASLAPPAAVAPRPAALPQPAPPAEVAVRPAAVPVPEPEAPPAPPEARAPTVDLERGLEKTRSGFIGRLRGLLRGRDALDAETLEEVESVLFGADLGVATADALLEAARGAGAPAQVQGALREKAVEMLAAVPPARPERGRPHVVLVVGVNGSGKTTSIGKLAMRSRRAGQNVVLGAGDTFRAAAIDQLEIWAERAGAEFVKGEPGGDPAAVAFDAVVAARSRGADVVLLDTAGRLQTDAGLMDELRKIARVVKKEIPDAPHEVILVLDANTGQNAIRQAREFKKVVDVDHILLSKLDGTAKGGVVLGIAQEVGLPVRYVGVGEAIDDLIDFDADAFVDALFAEG